MRLPPAGCRQFIYEESWVGFVCLDAIWGLSRVRYFSPVPTLGTLVTSILDPSSFSRTPLRLVHFQSRFPQ